jgi:hypothetical protein
MSLRLGALGPYPGGVNRAGAPAQSHMLYSLAGIFVAILVFATICAHSYKGGRELVEDARVSLLFGAYCRCIRGRQLRNNQHQRETRVRAGHQRTYREDHGGQFGRSRTQTKKNGCGTPSTETPLCQIAQKPLINAKCRVWILSSPPLLLFSR